MTLRAPMVWFVADLTCRALGSDDLPFVTALFRAPQMLAHRPDPTPGSAADIAETLHRDLAHWATHGIGRYCVLDGETPVALCGLAVKDGVEGLNVSYHVAPSLWGRGLASTLVGGLIPLARGLESPPSCLSGLVRPANPASARVLAKHGFQRVGQRPLGGATTDHWRLVLS